LHKSSLKHLATPAERKPNEKFIKTVFSKFLQKTILCIALETRKIDAWHLHEDYISLLLNAIKESSLSRIYE
jgi:N utilization substance protein B